MSLSEFFGIGGYSRPAEGYMSWQHLTFVTTLTLIMVLLAVFLGRKNKNNSQKDKNKVLIISAILIDAIEIFKIVMMCIRSEDAFYFIYELPLFLCSIQLVTIPLAAFSKGRIKEASLDFVMIFGLLGALMGTFFAGNNYAAYPVISIDNVASGLTHCISGFCSLYIMFSGLSSMKKQNISITSVILGGFCAAAYLVNLFTDCNYMFLMRGDGTPYDIIYNWVNSNAILYPLIVAGLFVIYIVGYYKVYYLITEKVNKKKAQTVIETETKETVNV